MTLPRSRARSTLLLYERAATRARIFTNKLADDAVKRHFIPSGPNVGVIPRESDDELTGDDEPEPSVTSVPSLANDSPIDEEEQRLESKKIVAYINGTFSS